MRLLLAGVIVALAAGLFPAPAAAHDAGSTLVTVSTGLDDLGLTAQIPLSRLDFAYHTSLARDPAQTVPAHRDWLTALVRDRVRLTTPDGAAWQVTVESVVADHLEGFDTARVEMVAVPPAGTRPGRADLRWRVVGDVVYTHKVFVGTTEHGTVELAGLITRQNPVIRLPVTASAPPVSFITMLRIGFEHFREGTDHLLFLCMVALAAGRRRIRPLSTVRRLALLTAAFTGGHSLSLALATLGWVALPSRWVEAGIALTIAVTAAHALRPRALPATAELAVTCAFGLIHGFGFAGTLRDLDLSGAGIAQRLLGFNLGLEAGQLLALALLAVPLWFLSRSATASYVVAGAATIVAGGWFLRRAFMITNPFEAAADSLLATPERLAVILFATALPILVSSSHRMNGRRLQNNGRSSLR